MSSFHFGVAGHPAEFGFVSPALATAAFHDPFEHSHVFAKAGPEEFAIGVLAEPIHMEDTRHFFDQATHAQPVGKVVAHVVTAEGQHRQRVTPHLANGASRCGSHLTAHIGSEEDAVRPVEGLKDKWEGGGAASTEDESINWHALGLFPIGINGGRLPGRDGEA
jgi:hypothetical protein